MTVAFLTRTTPPTAARGPGFRHTHFPSRFHRWSSRPSLVLASPELAKSLAHRKVAVGAPVHRPGRAVKHAGEKDAKEATAGDANEPVPPGTLVHHHLGCHGRAAPGTGDGRGAATPDGGQGSAGRPRRRTCASGQGRRLARGGWVRRDRRVAHAHRGKLHSQESEGRGGCRGGTGGHQSSGKGEGVVRSSAQHRQTTPGTCGGTRSARQATKANAGAASEAGGDGATAKSRPWVTQRMQPLSCHGHSSRAATRCAHPPVGAASVGGGLAHATPRQARTCSIAGARRGKSPSSS